MQRDQLGNVVIVLHHQNGLAWLSLNFSRTVVGRADIPGQDESEGAALAGGALHAQFAAHHLDQPPGDHQPQTGAAESAGDRAVDLLEVALAIVLALVGLKMLFGSPLKAVLGPDYNQAHADHFHFDRGQYRLCR